MIPSSIPSNLITWATIRRVFYTSRSPRYRNCTVEPMLCYSRHYGKASDCPSLNRWLAERLLLPRRRRVYPRLRGTQHWLSIRSRQRKSLRRFSACIWNRSFDRVLSGKASRERGSSVGKLARSLPWRHIRAWSRMLRPRGERIGSLGPSQLRGPNGKTRKRHSRSAPHPHHCIRWRGNGSSQLDSDDGPLPL